MKKFIVGFYYDLNGTMEVEAKDEKDAEKKVKNILEKYGIADEAKYNIYNRAYNSMNAKEIKCEK